MDQPQHIPFPLGWVLCDLGEYRPNQGTYSYVEYESLPPIHVPETTLRWLAAAGRSPFNWTVTTSREAAQKRLDAVATDAARLGLTLPESFARFMGAPELQDRIPEYAGWYFYLGDRFAPCPGRDGAYVVSFLYDQQDCVIWYLYLTPAGAHCVLAVPDPDPDPDSTPNVLLDIMYGEEVDAESVMRDLEAMSDGIMVCAPSFDEFLYRLWLETTIWFKLNGFDATPLTAEERNYLVIAEERYFLAHHQRQQEE